jgi:hypothetical protein
MSEIWEMKPGEISSVGRQEWYRIDLFPVADPGPAYRTGTFTKGISGDVTWRLPEATQTNTLCGTATLSAIVGDDLPENWWLNHLVRLVYSFRPANSALTLEYPLITGYPYLPSIRHTRLGEEVTFDISDPSCVFTDNALMQTLQNAAGVFTMPTDDERIIGTALPLWLHPSHDAAQPDGAAPTLTEAKTWNAGTSRLQVLNEFMQALGWENLLVDKRGKMHHRWKLDNSGVDLMNRGYVWDFAPNHGIYVDDLNISRTLDKIPTHLRAVQASTEGGGADVAVAYVSAGPYSAASRGRTIVHTIDGIDAPNLSNPPVASDPLVGQAIIKLKEAIRGASRIEIQHPYVDFHIGDTIRIREHPTAGTIIGTVTSMQMSIGTGMLVKTTIQETLTADIPVEAAL